MFVETEPSNQIERILKSDTFRSAAVLRRLLKFLADKAIAGEADELKEYSIGVDAFGKPSTYDPRSDAIVRLQVGRLRQKLGEYYRTEGKDDALVFELPKGHFKLKWETRPNSEPPARVMEERVEPLVDEMLPKPAVRRTPLIFALSATVLEHN